MLVPRLAAASLCAVLLSGCATSATPPSMPADDTWLASTSECCTADVGSLPTTAVSADQSLTLRFGPDTPVHVFAEGKAPFHVLELPKGQGPLRVSLASLVGRDANGQPYVFAPEVLLLDAQGRVQRRFDWSAFQYQTPQGFWGNRLTLGFSVSPGRNADRVVITTGDEALKATTELLHPARLQARARHLAVPPVANPIAAHRAIGEVRVMLRPLGETTGVLAPLFVDESENEVITAPSQEAHQMPTATATRGLEGLDFHRLIQAALAAGDIALAMELAERAEETGQAGTRDWLAEQLKRR